MDGLHGTSFAPVLFSKINQSELALRTHKPPPADPARWYFLERWRKLSREQLMREPLCRFHLQRGIPVKATIADHITPHKGDWNSFLTGELQSLCKQCHDTDKARVERIGYLPDIGYDGAPLDPNHPAAEPSIEQSVLLEHAIRRLNLEI
jgi:hypothetical protein